MSQMSARIFGNLIAYVGAFALTTLTLAYVLRVPHLLTGASDLADNYYVHNGYINVPLDFLLVTLYFLVAYGVCWCLRIQTKQVALRTVCIALVTVAISGFFVWYLTRRPPSSSFFSQWFHRVGWTGVVYDVFLLVVLYLVYRRLCDIGSVRPVM